jgi:hypothetical protein
MLAVVLQEQFKLCVKWTVAKNRTDNLFIERQRRGPLPYSVHAQHPGALERIGEKHRGRMRLMMLGERQGWKFLHLTFSDGRRLFAQLFCARA